MVRQRVHRPFCNRMAGGTAHARSAPGQKPALPRRSIGVRFAPNKQTPTRRVQSRRFVPLPDPCSAANGTGRVMSAGRLGKTERLRQRMPMRAYFAPLDATMSLYGEVTATSRSTYVSGSTIFYPVNTEASSMIISSPLFEAYLECANKMLASLAR
jgi:hypothetical protein